MLSEGNPDTKYPFVQSECVVSDVVVALADQMKSFPAPFVNAVVLAAGDTCVPPCAG